MKQRTKKRAAGRKKPDRPVDRLDDPVVLIDEEGKPAGEASKKPGALFSAGATKYS